MENVAGKQDTMSHWEALHTVQQYYREEVSE